MRKEEFQPDNPLEDQQFENIRISEVPRGSAPAAERCAEMVLLAMREPSRTAAKGYLGAAQWFALAKGLDT